MHVIVARGYIFSSALGITETFHRIGSTKFDVVNVKHKYSESALMLYYMQQIILVI